MNIKLFINCKITDKQGNIISEKEQEANSLVKAFAVWLRTNICVTVTESVLDTGNTSRTMAYAAAYGVASAGDTTQGMVIGTGTNAVTISDYALQTKIAHGTGAGQMSYGTQTFDSTVTVAGSTVYFNIARVFTNNSGSSITVKEAGLYILVSSYKYMFDRTLLDQAVSNGQTLTLQYKFQISV